MARRMLIDATHPEETRVVVLNGNRLEEFDFETSTKKQIKGNIYLAKITRVEPSLQAAFVEYGGNRHGFLAFSEIHPDYYRIPVSDREAIMAEERLAHDDDEAEPEIVYSEQPDHDHEGFEGIAPESAEPVDLPPAETGLITVDDQPSEGFIDAPPVTVETVGGDEFEEVQGRPRVRHYRNYKIQEVIKRRQILLIQVTKEERGNKGAALTTYLSLAGRYCVLMPNAGRGGGVSRKITSAADRRRLKDLMEELEVPDGMGVIVRTAGSERSQAEIKRDYDYLMRLWDDIRTFTLRSSAPALIYEEGNLIKRAIRDLYSRDIEEILVEGEAGYRTAKEFMRMLMPSHATRVKLYRDPAIPLFHRFQVDAQIDQIHNPVVQLRSGGYIVINPTEALVSIDVNSGRATRERNIEETATKTNLEASEEIARQLRLRDLAGLVVIDFIDMEENRNQKAVENRLKEAMKNDRARIQLGRISPFGLLELSRQRLRSSLIEASTQICLHCNGTGTIRSTESTALVILRALEEEGIRRRTAEVTIFVPTEIALYVLNQKRVALIQIEGRYGFTVTVAHDDSLIPPAYRLERMRALTPAELAALPAPFLNPILEEEEEEIEEEIVVAAVAEAIDLPEAAEAGETERGEDGKRRKRRRRKRRRGGPADGVTAEDDQTAETDDDEGDESEGETESAEAEDIAATADAPAPVADPEPETAEITEAPEVSDDADGEQKRRRRGKRGGRRRRREDGSIDTEAAAAEEAVEPEFDAAPEFEPYPSALDYARDGRELFHDEAGTALPPAEIIATPEPEPAPEPVAVTPEPESEPESPAIAPDPAPEAPSVGPKAEAAAVEPVTAEPEPAPAPKRRRTTKRKTEAAAETGAASEAPAATETPAPKRPRRRKAAAETVEIVPEAELVPAPEPLVELPEVVGTETVAVTESIAEAVIIEPAPEPVVTPEPEPLPEPEAVEDPNRPRRTGWWRRLTQG